jgi:hypothetical protein
MTADPFFGPLLTAYLGEHELSPSSEVHAPDGDADVAVEDWFAQAARGQARPSSGDSSPQFEQLGAAALPLDGDLVRPARQRSVRMPRRSPLPAHTAGVAELPALPRRSPRARTLVAPALLTTALLIAVIVVMRPVHPAPGAASSPTPSKGPITRAIHRVDRAATRRVGPVVKGARRRAAAKRTAQRRLLTRRARAKARAIAARRKRAASPLAAPGATRPPRSSAQTPASTPQDSCEFDLC